MVKCNLSKSKIRTSHFASPTVPNDHNKVTTKQKRKLQRKRKKKTRGQSSKWVYINIPSLFIKNRIHPKSTANKRMHREKGRRLRFHWHNTINPTTPTRELFTSSLSSQEERKKVHQSEKHLAYPPRESSSNSIHKKKEEEKAACFVPPSKSITNKNKGKKITHRLGTFYKEFPSPPLAVLCITRQENIKCSKF